MNKKVRGFTLVELLVVIAILAILATVSIVGYTSFIKKAYVSNDLVLVKQANNLIYQMKLEDKDISLDTIEQYAQSNGASISSYQSKTEESIVVFDNEKQQLVQCRWDGEKLVGLNDVVLPTNKKNIIVIIHNETDLTKYKDYSLYIASDYTGNNTVANAAELKNKSTIYDTLIVVNDFTVTDTTGISKDLVIYGQGYKITQPSGNETFEVKEGKTIELIKLSVTNEKDHIFKNKGTVIIRDGRYVAYKYVFNNDTTAAVTIYDGYFESNTYKATDNNIHWIRPNKGIMIVYSGTFKVHNAPYDNKGTKSFFWLNSTLNPSSLKPADKDITITFDGDTATIK